MLIGLLAFIGLIVVLSKGAKFFTALGKGLELLGDKINEYSSHKEIQFEPKNKTLRRLNKEIKDAEYNERVRKEIDALTSRGNL
jgi:hypothetical protein